MPSEYTRPQNESRRDSMSTDLGSSFRAQSAGLSVKRFHVFVASFYHSSSNAHSLSRFRSFFFAPPSTDQSKNHFRRTSNTHTLARTNSHTRGRRALETKRARANGLDEISEPSKIYYSTAILRINRHKACLVR